MIFKTYFSVKMNTKCFIKICLYVHNDTQNIVVFFWVESLEIWEKGELIYFWVFRFLPTYVKTLLRQNPAAYVFWRTLND